MLPKPFTAWHVIELVKYLFVDILCVRWKGPSNFSSYLLYTCVLLTWPFRCRMLFVTKAYPHLYTMNMSIVLVGHSCKLQLQILMSKALCCGEVIVNLHSGSLHMGPIQLENSICDLRPFHSCLLTNLIIHVGHLVCLNLFMPASYTAYLVLTKHNLCKGNC
jgi:hypothetical protein